MFADPPIDWVSCWNYTEKDIKDAMFKKVAIQVYHLHYTLLLVYLPSMWYK